MTMRILIVSLLVLGCSGVFAAHSTQALSMTLYDLAEWTTLLPGERSATPGLLLALALRLHMVLLTCTLATASTAVPRSIRMTTTLLLITLLIFQLPPLEFLSSFKDSNYQQQVLLVVLSLIPCCLYIFKSNLLNDYANFIFVIVGGIGLLLLGYALHRTEQSFQDYGLSVSVGWGTICLIMAYCLCLTAPWLLKRK